MAARWKTAPVWAVTIRLMMSGLEVSACTFSRRGSSGRLERVRSQARTFSMGRCVPWASARVPLARSWRTRRFPMKPPAPVMVTFIVFSAEVSLNPPSHCPLPKGEGKMQTPSLPSPGVPREGRNNETSLPHNEILDEEFHHAILVDGGVTAVGADLEVEAFARLLEGGDELHHVVWMHVVVSGAVVEHQASLELGCVR